MTQILFKRESTHETHGPFSPEELARWAGDGMVSGEDSVSFDGGATWHRASRILAGYLEVMPAQQVYQTPDRRRRVPRPLDLAPMIDVVFLLLIFFMITARIEATSSNATDDQARRDVAVSVPEVDERPNSEVVQGLTLTVLSEDAISFERRRFNLPEVISELRLIRSRENALLTIIVNADGALPYASVVKVVAGLEGAGVGRVLLGTVAKGD